MFNQDATICARSAFRELLINGDANVDELVVLLTNLVRVELQHLQQTDQDFAYFKFVAAVWIG